MNHAILTAALVATALTSPVFGAVAIIFIIGLVAGLGLAALILR